MCPIFYKFKPNLFSVQLYIGPPTHEDIYTGPYGVDYRKWNDMYPPWFKCFGEKDFIQNPMGDYEGVCDRYHARVCICSFALYQKQIFFVELKKE